MKIINDKEYIDFILSQDKTLKTIALCVYPKSMTDLYNALMNDTILNEIFDYFNDYKINPYDYKINPYAVIANDRKKCFMIEMGY